MIPVPFDEQNTVFAKEQTEYQPLPAFYSGGKEGYVISCWKLSFRERLRAFLHGRIYVSTMTFKQPLQPQLLTVDKWEVLNKEYFKNKKDGKTE